MIGSGMPISQSRSPRPIWVSVNGPPRFRENARPRPGFRAVEPASDIEKSPALTGIKADLRGIGVSHASTNSMERF
jgi:hypothetical protein